MFDGRGFSHPRHLVLLSSKPIGNQAHGRVWTVRGGTFMAGDDGWISTVSTIADWLKDAGLLCQGPPRARGGYYLVPTGDGCTVLDQKLRGGVS